MQRDLKDGPKILRPYLTIFLNRWNAKKNCTQELLNLWPRFSTRVSRPKLGFIITENGITYFELIIEILFMPRGCLTSHSGMPSFWTGVPLQICLILPYVCSVKKGIFLSLKRNDQLLTQYLFTFNRFLFQKAVFL